MVYVRCLNVSPLLDKIYRYAAIECAQTLTISFFDATALTSKRRLIFEWFLTSFLASLVYPEIALRSR